MSIEELSSLFKEYGRTLGSVESFTGGSFASSITALPGASKFFKGAVVTYATEEKVKLLGIDQNRVDTFGVVSQEIGGDMAMHGKYILNVDYAISFTGNAGPEAMENKPVGEVYIAVAVYKETFCFSFNLEGSREEIQAKAVEIATDLLAELLEQKK